MWRNAVLNVVITSIDVGVDSAVGKDKAFSFKTLHKKCNTPVKQQYICPSCNVVADETVKGIEFPKGNWIPVTDEEIASTYPEVKSLINISKFIPDDTLNPMLFEDPYWLVPKEGVYGKQYTALRNVMLGSQLVGIGKVAFTDKEHPVVLVATGQGLVLWMLSRPGLVRVPNWELPEPDEMQLKMTTQVVSMMTAPLETTDFDLEQTAKRSALIEKKQAGVQVAPVVQREAAAVANVLDSLRESVAILQEQRKSRKKVKA